MKTYEIHYYGLGGEDFEGTLDWKFSKKDLALVKQAIDDGWEGFDETDDLEGIYSKIADAVAEFGMENWENVSEIYDLHGGDGATHKEVMKRYLQNCGMSVPFPEELIEDLEEEDDS
jgi:hypothetical protein